MKSYIIVFVIVFLLSMQSRCEIIHYETASCDSSVEDPVIRSQAYKFCYFMKEFEKCAIPTFTQDKHAPSFFPFTNCSYNKCVHDYTIEESACIIESTGIKRERIPSAMKNLCYDPFQVIFISPEESGAFCFFPLPEGSQGTISSHCSTDIATVNEILIMPMNISSNPYSCVVVGYCNSISDPVSIVCFNQMYSVNELFDMVNSEELSLRIHNDAAIIFDQHYFANLCVFLFFLTLIPLIL